MHPVSAGRRTAGEWQPLRKAEPLSPAMPWVRLPARARQTRLLSEIDKGLSSEAFSSAVSNQGCASPTLEGPAGLLCLAELAMHLLYRRTPCTTSF